MTELQYIRTDRNGTKIFHDWTCSRCGGAGRSDNWWRTGYTCHECGGTGKRNTPKVVKEYTPEHAAKLEARRAAKALANLPSEAELQAMAAEAQRNAWKDEGISAEGIAYIHTGDTFKHKDAIRRAGGKWCSYIRAWVAPKKVPNLQGVQIIEVQATDICNEYNRIDPEKVWDMQEQGQF